MSFQFSLKVVVSRSIAAGVIAEAFVPVPELYAHSDLWSNLLDAMRDNDFDIQSYVFRVTEYHDFGYDRPNKTLVLFENSECAPLRISIKLEGDNVELSIQFLNIEGAELAVKIADRLTKAIKEFEAA